MLKTKISPYGKVKLYWNDKPENYSRANRLAVRNSFAKKYGVDKERVKVVYRPVKVDNKGNLIKLDGVQIESVGDILYQRKLFKEWLVRNEKDIDFERLIKLDDKVNADLDSDVVQGTNKKWEFEWIMIDNLLSFGDDNFFPIDRFKGLTTVCSSPENQGGKTTLIIDSFKFLLFGITTKTSKNEHIFNRYRDKSTLVVRGLMKIEGEEEFVIERKLSRKAKRDGGWNVSSTLNYYKMLPDDTEESMDEEHTIRTTSKIRETVGDVKDFDLVSLATGDNLTSLIGNTVTENGKIFTRMIGLEVMEVKEAIARKMYNEFHKDMQSNIYSKVELEDENEISEANLELVKETQIQADEKLISTTTKIENLETEKSALLSSKHVVDSKLSMTTIESLDQRIATITNDGKKAKETMDELKESYNGIEVDYDEYKEKRTADKIGELKTSVAIKRVESTRLIAESDALDKAESCVTCGRALEGVDNSKMVKDLSARITNLDTEIIAIDEELLQLNEIISSLAEVKVELERKQRLELEIERGNLKLTNLRGQLTDVRETKKQFEANVQAIKHNQDTDVKVNKITSDLQIERHTKEETIRKIEVIKGEIIKHDAKIAMNKTILTKMLKEGEIERIFKMYIEMVGKKGVSKIILRSVIPIINAELDRLLEGVCNFEVEVRMDDKNDVNLIIIKDGVEGSLKSGSGLEKTIAAIGLRCVLGVVSTLPMPNFIAFDEVFGKVAQVNIPLLKPLFDKVADSYDKVFVITHNEQAKDWANKIITVVADKNVSKIDYK